MDDMASRLRRTLDRMVHGIGHQGPQDSLVDLLTELGITDLPDRGEAFIILLPPAAQMALQGTQYDPALYGTGPAEPEPLGYPPEIQRVVDEVEALAEEVGHGRQDMWPVDDDYLEEQSGNEGPDYLDELDQEPSIEEQAQDWYDTLLDQER